VVNTFEEIRCLDVSLADKLSAYSSSLTKDGLDISRVYSVLVERLLAANAGAQAPEIGTELPAFLLPDNKGRLVNSAELLRRGPLVVSFNRGHWCSFCQFELLALADIQPEVECLGGQIISIMPECAASTTKLKNELQLAFPVLTDIDNGFALNCSLMISLGDAFRQAILDAGLDLAEFQRNDAWFVPIPVTFVLGSDGRVVGRFVDADFRHRMAPDDILQCLKKVS